MRVRIVVKHLDDLQVGCPVDRIAADAHAGGLAHATQRHLPYRFVGQRAAPGSDADVPFLVNITGGDADAATAVRILARARSHNAGAIRPQQSRLAAGHGPLHLHHVLNGDEFGDADNQVQLRIDRLENGIRGKGWRDEHGGNRSPGFAYGIADRVENRHVLVEAMSALARNHTAHNPGAVLQTQTRVQRAKVARDALHHHPRVRLN